jgi:type IV secretion system protein VirB10
MNTEATVPGERTFAHVSGGRSLRVRAHRLVAIGLVVVIGAAVLTWYYLHLAAESRAGTAAASSVAKSAAASEMKLPPFGTARPTKATAPTHATPAMTAEAAADSNGETRTVIDTPAAQGRAAPHGVTGHERVARLPAFAAAEASSSTNAMLARLAAPVLVRSQATPALGDLEALARRAVSMDGTSREAGSDVRPGSGAGLGAALEPTLTKPVQAAIVPTRRWLLPKGAFLDCTLETAIDSTLPGMATCILAADIFGADGRVVLLERGTKLVGETRSDVRAGQARVAVLWNEARTPTGVVVALVSPGTDALGRSGVAGALDTHFGERFGAAVLVSLIDGAVSGIAARQPGTGTVVYNMQGSRDVATEVLRSTINIPPTIRVPQGERVAVLVARDVDFGSVYRLTTRAEP